MAETRPPGRLYRTLRATLLITGLTVLGVLALELGARTILELANRVLRVGATEELADRPAFDHVDYDGAALIAEQERFPRTAYQPYTVWRAHPFDGEYFHVDELGERRTVPMSDAPDALEIWMLGGSSMVGYGAPDAQTLPSHLARLLQEEWGVAARVRNLGQGGWVSAQEVVRLLRGLEAGESPHLAIFYDGYNDAVAMANWPEDPGTHFQVDRIRARFETAWAAPLQSSGLLRVVHALRHRWGGPERPPRSDAQTALLGRRAAEVWWAHHRQATALGREYGFPVLFLLQPVHRHSLMAAFREEVRAHPRPGVHDLGDALEGMPHPVFIDSVHVTGPGNERIARRILPLVRHALCTEAEVPAAEDLAKVCRPFPAGP